ncbi:MAG: DUF2726 domain-containing protein [Chloroflexota bacterium]
MKKILEFFRGIFISLIKAFLELLGESKEETKQQSESETGEQKITQQVQREPVRSIDLGIASPDSPKYRKNRSVLTKPEHILYQALLQAKDNEHIIFVKVRMGDFVFLANEPQDRKFHVNQVLCKHVDFLFCDIQTLEPLLVVELDDSSHKQHEHFERDEFKNNTFNSVGLPYMRIKVQQEYSSDTLRAQIKERIKQRQSSQYKN